MKIQRNEGIKNFYNFKKNEEFQNDSKPQESLSKVGLISKFNDHRISFGSRVDKGLDRFYEVNKDKMPLTVNRYVKSLEDKSRISPLEAQRRAFIKLENAKTVEELKNMREPLFDDLIMPSETRATRGILGCYRENKELLELSEQDILKNKEDFTLYLVKKIFLEAKTIDEINKDLEKDLNEDFKADFKYKNPDSKYIYTSTLKALGIQTPCFEYQNSLRYTRDGYSDFMGEKIHDGLEAYYELLSDEDKISRAKKSVMNFENWWASLSQQEKLEMVANLDAILEMKKSYKKVQRAEKKQNQQSSDVNENQEPKPQHKHTKVGSKKLKEDELFIKWATRNLQIFEQTLSEADKDSLHLKRMRNLVNRWEQMSPEERTDYISQMKAGAEPLRFAMIDAWNNCTDIIKELSLYLKDNQIFKPADMLYSDAAFSEFQSKIMTQFWASNPEFAVELGDAIKASQSKVELAIKNGTFDALKKQILRNKNERIKEMSHFKKVQDVQAEEPVLEMQQSLDYKTEFKKAYELHVYGKLKSLPKSFYNDVYEAVLRLLPEDVIVAWTKNLRGEEIPIEQRARVEEFLFNEPKEISRYNRALEAAMADALYELTGNPDVFRLSNSDVKTAIYHAERNEYPIMFHSNKLNETFVLKPLPGKAKKKVDASRINFLYNKYKENLSMGDIKDIIEYYFINNQEIFSDILYKNSNSTVPQDSLSLAVQTKEQIDKIEQDLIEYVSTYGKSALILFSDKSAYPAKVKSAFNSKFLANMPDSLKQQNLKLPLLKSKEDIEKEQCIAKACYAIGKRFDFVSEDYMNVYKKELAYKLRNGESLQMIDDIATLAGVKRKDAKSTGKLLVIPKSDFTIDSKLRTLAMEQALADVLYESTQSLDVYRMDFENLCDLMEVFRLVKKFPSESRQCKLPDDTHVSLVAYKNPNTYKLKSLYQNYLEEMNSRLVEFNAGKIDKESIIEEFMFALNPDENMPQKDANIIKRLENYSFPVEDLKKQYTLI